MTWLKPGASIGHAAALFAALVLLPPSIARAQEGPSSTGADLHDGGDPLTDPQYRSSLVKDVLAPWFDLKAKAADTYRAEFGLDYQALYQHADNDFGDDEASSGQFRVFGGWTPFKDEAGNSGGFTFKVENRHAYTDVAPQDLGFQAGALSITGASFSDSDDWLLTDASWTQRFIDGRAVVRGGFVDLTDYVDVYGLINPRTAFSNLAFLTNPTIPAPDPGLGLAGSAMLADNVYAIAGIADANSDPTLSENPFSSFFDTAEYFTHVEIGYTSAKERVFFDNIHLTAWHADQRDDAGVDDDWG
ncbi:MAG: carbohydrate porin, partial [Geminicoccaceae bacterium]